MKKLRSSIFALAGLLIALVFSYLYSFFTDSLDWLKDISLNVGTEVLGILLTVWLIEAVIRKNELKEKERIKTLAASQVRLPLLHHVTMLTGIYKASLASAPLNPPMELAQLFGPHYAIQLQYFDFAKLAPTVYPQTWFDYLHLTLNKFCSDLSRTIEKYAVFLDIETLELLEALMASSLTGFLTQAHGIPGAHKHLGVNQTQYYLFAGQGVADLIHQHTDLVQRLVELTNLRLPESKKIKITMDNWNNTVAPQFGSAR